MMYYRQQPEEAPEYVVGREYTARQLELMADELLREDSRSELCRDCGRRGQPTGNAETMQQPLYDAEGTLLVLEFPEFECNHGHRWFQGEGAVRGIGGESPILFEEHFQSRRRREIYTQNGTPDPEIVSGIYNRIHPNGRKVNSTEQRKKNGASFYR